MGNGCKTTRQASPFTKKIVPHEVARLRWPLETRGIFSWAAANKLAQKISASDMGKLVLGETVRQPGPFRFRGLFDPTRRPPPSATPQLQLQRQQPSDQESSNPSLRPQKGVCGCANKRGARRPSAGHVTGVCHRLSDRCA